MPSPRALPLLMLALSPMFATAPAQAGGGPVVAIDTGKVQGAVAGGVASWKGIPFAAPPVGALRWRAPQPAAAWSGVRQAQAYGNDCMQLPFPSDAAPLGTPPAEDCLYVNVWRPAAVRAAHKLPVSVRLEKVFVRFKPTYFGCSAPQIHREDWSG